jgi:hypothetical protein
MIVLCWIWGPQSVDCEDYGHLDCSTETSGFRRNTLRYNSEVLIRHNDFIP